MPTDHASEKALHFVCTHEEAYEIVDGQKQFWVSNCGCREETGDCKVSRTDLCLQFTGSTAASGTGKRKITRRQAEGLLKEAAEKRLVARPFRDDETRSVVEGICFCCPCCCGYFHNPEDRCDPGNMVARTDADACTNCGECVPECRFGARKMVKNRLVVDTDKCYGCGLCETACPPGAIHMVVR